MNLLLTRLSAILLFALFTGCGGGGGTKAPVVPIDPVNVAPIANAGVNQIVRGFSVVTLSGSGVDSDGSISAYSWVQKSGTQVTIANNTTPTANFTAPNAEADEILSFTLTVTDNDGASHSDDVDITVTNRSDFFWSEVVAWGGALPQTNDDIIIPNGITIRLDISPPTLGNITINGTLIFGDQAISLTANSILVEGELLIGNQDEPSDIQLNLTVLDGLTIEGTTIFGQQNIALTADWILVNGSFQVGSEGSPYTKLAVITLTGTSSQDIMNMGSRGLLVMGGTLQLHGNPPQTTWTKISQHIEAGSSQFSVLESNGWKTGDQVVLAPTDFYEVGGSQLMTISSVNGLNVTTSNAVEKFHWGLMQYATTTGMSLTQGISIPPPAPVEEGATPSELDERAEIGNLSRNIIIQSIDDSSWQSNGFGAQVMIMGLDSVVQVDGVEIRRAGQAGISGRYPFHWHRLSYPDGITEIGDVNGHYLRNSSIHNSKNRCVTLHATNGVRFENNICYDIKGHGIFFEDAVERRNIIENNLVLGIRFPAVEDALMLHEITQGGVESGSSGIWITNPDNTIRNNVFADSEGFGIWMAFPERAQTVSAGVSINPSQLGFGNFDNNTVHSNFTRGVMFDFPPVDNDGRVFPLQYGSRSEVDDPTCLFNGYQRFSITGWKLWKNSNNFWNRARCVNYKEFVSADGVGKFFAGAGQSGLITRALIVGSSLNNFSENPKPYIGPATALATYHSAFDMTKNIIMNFPLVESKTSGAFATDDYYTRPVEKGAIRNVDNLLINSHAGHRSDARIDEDILGNFAQGFDHFVFAGALLDQDGMWGPAANWNVYNNPFLTFNADCVVIEPPSENTRSCDGQYFGVNQFYLDKSGDYYVPLMAIAVERFNELSPEDPAIGRWDIAGSQSNSLLAGMKDFAVRQGGIYKLVFPESPTPNDVAIDISNMHSVNDYFIIAIRFDGANDAKVYATSAGFPGFISDEYANSAPSTSKHDYTELMSKQAVIDSQGESFWQDSNNDLIWIKIAQGGLQQTGSSNDEFSDLNLYKTFRIRVW